MSMDVLLHEVLRKVKSGGNFFDPEQDAGGDLEKFQSIAKAVVHAQSKGYLSRMIPSMDGQRAYDRILVDGGLTYEGECFLQKLSGQLTPADEALTDLLGRLSSYEIREKWGKALSRRVADPSGALTAARSLLETTLKFIIEQRGGTPTDDNKKLFHSAIDALGIEAKGKPIEKIIEGLNSIIWGIGDMRNMHGDAHGATSNSTSPTVRQAGFCVNLACAAALYLLEEFEASKSNG